MNTINKIQQEIIDEFNMFGGLDAKVRVYN